MKKIESFINQKNKRITILGMSGVGKTHLSNILRKEGGWFHYSADYRIGSRYLDEAILDNIKYKMMQNPFLKNLLISDSIYINHNITFDNLLPVSSFLGKIGNPEQGGLPFDEFKRRQKLHHDAEINAMLDLPKFIDKAQKIYQYPHFINDAGGSLCELDNQDVINTLSEYTLIVYLKANKESEAKLIKRALKNPKPLYYQAGFLTRMLSEYLSEQQLDYVAQINPDDFSRWVFPKLFYHRIPKYEALAKQYGVTIESEQASECNNAEDLFTLIEHSLTNQI